MSVRLTSGSLYGGHGEHGGRFVRVLALALVLAVGGTNVQAPAALAARKKTRRRTVVYTVKRGDTLSKIARRYRVTVVQIKRWNRLKGNRIYAGRRLRLAPPVCRHSRHEQLVDPVQMPPGDGYHLKNPDESWGTQRTTGLISTALATFRDKHPDSTDVVIGDISLRQGGYFPPHVSHRDGRDVDVGLLATRNRRLTYFMKMDYRSLDVEKTWDLIEAFLATGEVELILLDRSLQRLLHREAKKRGYSERRLSRLFQWPRSRRTRYGLIRHSRGHRDHMHVRFRKATRPEVAQPASDAPSETIEGPPAPVPGDPARGPDSTATVPGPITRD